MSPHLAKWLFIIRPLATIIFILAKLSYSKNLIARIIGKVFFVPIERIIGNNIYSVLALAQETNKQKNSSPASSCTKNIVLQAFINHSDVTDIDIYKALSKIDISPTVQFVWAHKLLGLGRLDLSRATFMELIDNKQGGFPLDKKLETLRDLGIVCFMLGKNKESNYYWNMAGKLRCALSKPITPRKYRILGKSWFIAIGHIAMLDFYLKYKKLYFKEPYRIVMNPDMNVIPAKELLNKFIELGIVLLKPHELEKDYNKWAKANFAPLWKQLTIEEKTSLVDDFWEYDFQDGTILGYAHAAARIQKEWEQANYSPLLKLSNEEKNWLANYLSLLGIPKNAWYVCLHIREAGFHKQWNRLYPSLRDANIEDYYSAIEEITHAGGWVLRMGDSSMKPLISLPQVIDYAHSYLKTPLADILLVAGCKFFLGTNSGYATVAAIYNVPCALSNWIPLGWPLWPSQDIMIPKLFRRKSSRIHLTLEEMFSTGLAFIQNWKDLPVDIEVVDNSLEDLQLLVREMLEKLNTPNHKTGSMKSIQNAYALLANKYHAFTGSELAESFVENHMEIFQLVETTLQPSQGEQVLWPVQSNNNITVILN